MSTRIGNIGFSTTTSPETGSTMPTELALSGATSVTPFDGEVRVQLSDTSPNLAPPRTGTIQSLPAAPPLVYPLFVVIQQDGPDTWSAQSDDLGRVGCGASDFEAMDDLRSQVAELFVMLQGLKDELGPQPMEHLRLLEKLSGGPIAADS